MEKTHSTKPDFYQIALQTVQVVSSRMLSQLRAKRFRLIGTEQRRVKFVKRAISNTRIRRVIGFSILDAFHKNILKDL